MAVVGKILKSVVERSKVNMGRKQIGVEQQEETLRKLLTKARNTQIGRKYGFRELLDSPDTSKIFQQKVPIYHYEKMYEEFWKDLQSGSSNVSWPGKVKFFGLTSGTSNDSSKRVPLTRDMIKSIRKTGIRQLLALSDFDLPPGLYQKSVLMLGGSTDTIKIEDYFEEGDLSGILQKRLPFWINRYAKPGKPIARERDWNTKLERIVDKAPRWDIVGIAGVPAWVQILIEKIIERYKVDTIHDIWPNFTVFAHGGVAFTPYKKSFEGLLGKPIYYLETYLASEGFLAYQRDQDSDMQLVLDNGIFFEFIPFNQDNFHPDGQLKENPECLLISEVEEGVDYAILISTNAGAWRYMIGDTIRFTRLKDFEIVITGRTKHFLSLCGEHLSVDNMTQAISRVSDEMDIHIREFTVAGIPYENLFAHHWYIGVDEAKADAAVIREKLDRTLKELNDDYATERKAALKEIFVEVLPLEAFYSYLRIKGKEGAQHKFPRVLDANLPAWLKHIKPYTD